MTTFNEVRIALTRNGIGWIDQHKCLLLTFHSYDDIALLIRC